MAKFLLFSDIHVHPHKNKSERLDDCLTVLDWVYKTAIAQDVDFVLFGGDLLHDRFKIDSLTYMETFKILEKYQKCRFLQYFILGNHDLWFGNSTKVSSTYPFGALEKIEVIDVTKSMNIGGVTWHFMPYTHDPIEELKKLPKKEMPNSYMLGHLAIDGAKLNSAGSIADVCIENDDEMVPIGKNLFTTYKRAFFGHYHSAQKLTERMEYIGSPLQLSFGEANESKHVIILDSSNDSLKYIENSFSPKHLYLNENNFQNIDKELLKNSYISLNHTSASDPRIIKEIEDFAKEHQVANIKIKNEPTKTTEHALNDVKKVLSDEPKLLENYIEQDSSSELDKDKRLFFGKKIIKASSEGK